METVEIVIRVQYQASFDIEELRTTFSKAVEHCRMSDMLDLLETPADPDSECTAILSVAAAWNTTFIADVTVLATYTEPVDFEEIRELFWKAMAVSGEHRMLDRETNGERPQIMAVYADWLSAEDGEE